MNWLISEIIIAATQSHGLIILPIYRRGLLDGTVIDHTLGL